MPEMHVIEDVSESNEVSQRGFDTLNKGQNAFSKSSFTKSFAKENKSKKSFRNERMNKDRGELNNSDLIKSCSENISQIMEATLREDEQKRKRELKIHEKNRSSVDNIATKYFNAKHSNSKSMNLDSQQSNIYK